MMTYIPVFGVSGLEFLIGSLLSSNAEKDLLSINPFLSQSDISTVLQLAISAIVYSNRIGQINRCLSYARSVIELLDDVSRLDCGQRVPGATRAGLIQKGELLASSLTTQRYFMHKSENDNSFSFGETLRVFCHGNLTSQFSNRSPIPCV